MGSRAVRPLRRRTRPPVPRAGGAHPDHRPGRGRRPRLRPRHPDRDPRHPLPGRGGARDRLVPADARRGGALATPQLSFQLGDIAGWRPQRGSVDVIVANASLQWVPDHAALLPVLAAGLDDGGTLAFQVPTGGPILDADILDPGVPGPRGATPVREPAWYVRTLAALGLTVDAWETTYFHVLPGEDPVLEWFSGTGLRPYLDALSGAELDDFRARVAARLRDRYPREPFGTILPFPRLFVVAHRP
ncbi:hypothetical protein GCM10027610_132730 [Dactylosporangium cerinum]